MDPRGAGSPHDAGGLTSRCGGAHLADRSIAALRSRRRTPAFGAVFPELPGDLLGGGFAPVSHRSETEDTNDSESQDFGVEPTRIELSFG